MTTNKNTQRQTQQLRVDKALGDVLAFPNYIRWLVFTPSGRAALDLSAENRKVKYEDQFGAMMERVTEANADVEAESCGR